MNVKDITNILKNSSGDDVRLISRAFDFAVKGHEGQKRFSGDPYFVHPYETAKTLARLQLDAVTIAAGLLHDVCEQNSDISEKELKKEFGDEIVFLVSGVSRLGSLKYQGAKRHAESLRKMFLAMTKDVRVVLIRLADRLHNMSTLQYVPKEKQKRIAFETLEIYAPLANRLGMGEIKGKLEDYAFPYTHPGDYKKIMELMEETLEEKQKNLAKVKYKLKSALEKNGIKYIKADSRVKHAYSLFKKLQKKDINMDIDKIYDLIAMRVIVKTTEDCYKAMGIIHKIWRPLPGRIKDYIALPKPNGYQSLHTTVFAVGGNITEIQIRTEKMHEEAEYGIAAHWAYAESGKPKKVASFKTNLAWVDQLVEWQKNVSKSKDFLEELKIDFFNDRVFCFTPKGDVIDLPVGAAVIDFAYTIHSDIGDRAIGAMVNKKFVSLDSVLSNGDIVEIKIDKNKKPNLEAFKYAKTSMAKKRIKSAAKKINFSEKFKHNI